MITKAGLSLLSDPLTSPVKAYLSVHIFSDSIPTNLWNYRSMSSIRIKVPSPVESNHLLKADLRVGFIPKSLGTVTLAKYDFPHPEGP